MENTDTTLEVLQRGCTGRGDKGADGPTEGTLNGGSWVGDSQSYSGRVRKPNVGEDSPGGRGSLGP